MGRRWSEAGLGPGSVLTIEQLRGLPLLRTILAAWFSGAIPHPQESGPGSETPSFLVSSAEGVLLVGPGCDGLDRKIVGGVIHSTSGSTGQPRLAWRSPASLLGECHRYGESYSLSPADRLLSLLPIQHSFGWGYLLAGLVAGCHIDLWETFSPQRAARRFDGDASVVALTPTMAHLLILCGGPPPKHPPRPGDRRCRAGDRASRKRLSRPFRRGPCPQLRLHRDRRNLRREGGRSPRGGRSPDARSGDRSTTPGRAVRDDPADDPPRRRLY